jgi:hypothetical protein
VADRPLTDNVAADVDQSEQREMAMAVPADVQATIDAPGDWRSEMIARLRGLVLAAVPELAEDIKWKMPSKPEGVLVWSLGGNVCMAGTLKRTVRLTFPKGAQLADPDRLFNAQLESKSVRAIDFPENAEVPDAAVQALVRAAADLNRDD